jgi:hypothetical protein
VVKDVGAAPDEDKAAFPAVKGQGEQHRGGDQPAGWEDYAGAVFQDLPDNPSVHVNGQ